MAARAPRPLPSALALAVAAALAACGGDAPTEPLAATVDVSPGQVLLVGEGDGARFVAVARDADGAIVPASPTWSIDRPQVAAVTGDGFVTAVAGGTATVTATVGTASGSARLEVYVPLRIRSYEPGRSYMGRRDYAEYIPGRLPVILSSAHGGQLTPQEIPDRTYGVVRNDINTLDLTLLMRRALIDLTGYAPHVVLVHLHRSKLDANREIVEAAQGSRHAELAWEEFQGWIMTARAAVGAEFGKGLYLDIHGHAHDIDRVELGYLLTRSQLNRPDASLNSLDMVARTSIRDLGRTSPIPFSQLLRGPSSFGGMLADEGIASVPSPNAPGPGDAPYFTGGYNTREHGSVHDAEVVDGIQLEHHFPGLRDTGQNRFEYARRAARVIRRFMLEHYGFFEPSS